MDILSSLIGAGLAFLGLLLGRVVERRREKRRQALDSLKPICTCTHYKNLHKDNGKGRCNGYVKLKGTASSLARWDNCPCLSYLGPTPIEELLERANPGTKA